MRRGGRVDGAASGPGAPVVGAEDGADGEEPRRGGRGGFVDEDEGFAVGVGVDSGDGGHAVAGGQAAAGDAGGWGPGEPAIVRGALQGVLVLGVILAGVVELEGVGAVGCGAEVGFPVAGDRPRVAGGLGEVAPRFAAVIGGGDGYSEEGVGASDGIFAVVPESAEDAGGGGGELEEVGVVDVVGIRGAAGDFSERGEGGAVVGGAGGEEDVGAGLEGRVDGDDGAVTQAGGARVGAGADGDGGAGQGWSGWGSREEKVLWGKGPVDWGGEDGGYPGGYEQPDKDGRKHDGRVFGLPGSGSKGMTMKGGGTNVVLEDLSSAIKYIQTYRLPVGGGALHGRLRSLAGWTTDQDREHH